MKPDPIHIYQNRHLFRGGDHIGGYDAATRCVRLHGGFAAHRGDVAAWFLRVRHIRATVLVGDEPAPPQPPPVRFPDEIRALMSPYLGDLTPSVLAWARANLTPEEFQRHYSRGRAGKAPEKPAAPSCIPAAAPHPLGLPAGAPETLNALRKFLKQNGVKLSGSLKKPALIALYQQWAARPSEESSNESAPAPGKITPPAAFHHLPRIDPEELEDDGENDDG